MTRDDLHADASSRMLLRTWLTLMGFRHGFKTVLFSPTRSRTTHLFRYRKRGRHVATGNVRHANAEWSSRRDLCPNRGRDLGNARSFAAVIET